MGKDKDNRNKGGKKRNRHDNSSGSKNDNFHGGFNDDINDDNDCPDDENVKGDSEKDNKPNIKMTDKDKEEMLKKKKEAILKKKISLAKEFDVFKCGVYKQTGLDQIGFLDALNELERETLIKPEATLSRVRVFLQEINQIRQELARLDSNLAGAIYYENEVFPLLNSLFFLAGMAGDLSLVARNLIQVSLAKNSKIEDAITLTYRMVRLSERVFNLLEIKIYKLIRILSVNE